MQNWWGVWRSKVLAGKKTPASQREAGVRITALESLAWAVLQRRSMVAGDTIDIGTRNAQVVELAIVESGELTNGLLISGPLFESLANVHLKSPFVYELVFSGSVKNEQGLIYQ
jgi:hypothetical protein